jgi:hypothetical protein
MSMIQTTNLRQIPRIPPQGEIYISLNVGRVENLKALLDVVETIGFIPELVSIQFPNRIEIHLLLHHEHRTPNSLVGDEFDSKLDVLAKAGIPDKDVRFVYGGERIAA